MIFSDGKSVSASSRALVALYPGFTGIMSYGSTVIDSLNGAVI